MVFMPLTVERIGYKPFEYPWAYETFKLQNKMHWLPDEIPMTDDVREFQYKLSDAERNLATHIFRFFTQSDIEVQDNYLNRYAGVFKPTEVKMAISAITNIECVHIDAYSHVLETLGMPPTIYNQFMEYAVLKEKYDFFRGFSVDDPYQVARTLGAFAAYVEGTQLFASFAMLMNFPRNGTMRGMGQVVSWSVRDESLHCQFLTMLLHQWIKEHRADIDVKRLAEDYHDIRQVLVGHEDRFVDLAFEMGPVTKLEPQDVKNYIRYVVNHRNQALSNPSLGLSVRAPYGQIKSHPLPWLQPLLGGVEHVNFFEQRGTAYSKSSSKGNFHGEGGVWDRFDKMLAKRDEAKAEA